jgi:hypothetical protein
MLVEESYDSMILDFFSEDGAIPYAILNYYLDVFCQFSKSMVKRRHALVSLDRLIPIWLKSDKNDYHFTYTT